MQYPNNGLTLVSLFAGCGGSSLGYKQAGYDVRLAVEWDADAAQTYKTNFPGVNIFRGDIASLSNIDALRMANVESGELDVLDGSPPCQGFSMAGKRIFGDIRNELFHEYARLLQAFMPKMFVMENVSGLIKGKMKLIFAEMTKVLKQSGYQVSCRLLNAWWYGVPQDRKRLIWIGVRDDLKFFPSHPQPSKKRPITVAQSLGPLMMKRSWNSIRNAQLSNKWKTADDPAPTLEAMRPPMVRITGSFTFPINASKKAQSTFKPAPTLAAIRPPSVIDINDGVRYLTIEEAKILQGFPAWFKVEKYKYIGNSVAPPMAKAIGKHIAELLGAAPTLTLQE